MASQNGFREDEIVNRKVKINGEWQTRTFPVVGGRLRLAHEQNDNLSLPTELVNWDGQYAVFKCCAVERQRAVHRLRHANSQRDARLADRLLSWRKREASQGFEIAGFGLEFTGLRKSPRSPRCRAFIRASWGQEPKPAAAEPILPSETEAKAPDKPCHKANGGSKATQAQARALFALTRKAKMGDEDIAQMLSFQCHPL